MNKNILVTGGLGFIGSHLVDRLIDEKYFVVVIDNLSTGLESNKNKKAKYIKEDITDYINSPKRIDNIIQDNKIDIVYHLAASADITLSLKNPEKVFTINTTASIAIINSCIRNNVKNFLFTSTSAVYGEPTYLPVDEKHKTNPISPYGLSKLFTEQYLQYISQHNTISSVIFRLPNVYGPRQRPDLEGGVIAIFDNLMKSNEIVNIFGDGEQSRDWVHVYDIVNAFIESISIKNQIELLLLGSSKKNTINELFGYLAIINQYRLKPVYIEKRSGDIENMVMDNDYAKKLISWKAKITLEEGLNTL